MLKSHPVIGRNFLFKFLLNYTASHTVYSSAADISKHLRPTPQQSRWVNKMTVEGKNMSFLILGCSFDLVQLLLNTTERHRNLHGWLFSYTPGCFFFNLLINHIRLYQQAAAVKMVISCAALW